MSMEQDKLEFIEICESMEKKLQQTMKGATKLEIVAAIGFSLWQRVKKKDAVSIQTARALSDGQRRALHAAIRWAEAAGHEPIMADLKSLIVAGVAASENIHG
jgi:hypothetical protein